MYSSIDAHLSLLPVTLQLPVVVFLALLSQRAAGGLGTEGYRAVGWGWVFNFLYLLATIFSKVVSSPELSPIPSLLNLATELCFLYASSYGRIQPIEPERRKKFKAISAVAIGSVIWEILWVRLGVQGPIVAFPAALINAYILFLLADFFRDIERERLPLEGRSKHLVRATQIYALLQLFYILAAAHFANVPEQLVEAIAFSIALLLKFLIAIGILELLQAAAKVGAQIETERKAIESERKAIARVLHELGTPIPQLEVQVARALEKALPNQPLHTQLNAIYNTALRAVAIHGASGELPLTTEWTLSHQQRRRLEENLTASDTYYVNTLIEIARISVKDTRHEQVIYHIQYAGRCCIDCIKTELIQVLINVLRNAYDAFPDGMGEIWIKTSFRNEGQKNMKRSIENQRVEITVRDNGEGIAESVRDQMFQEGFSTRGRGRGFGMSIIQELVEKNGGEMMIRSPLHHNIQRPGTEIVLSFARVPCHPKRQSQ